MAKTPETMDHHNCPPHHKYSSPLINIDKIPKWLHSHPHSVHFDKGEVLPHHRLIGGNPATWSPFKLAKEKQQVKNIPKPQAMTIITTKNKPFTFPKQQKKPTDNDLKGFKFDKNMRIIM